MSDGSRVSQSIMKCLCSGEQAREDSAVTNFGGPEIILEAESSICEGGCLNYEVRFACFFCLSGFLVKVSENFMISRKQERCWVGWSIIKEILKALFMFSEELISLL